jgi:hypothetical protein
MESVWLLLDSDPVCLGFLGRSPFRCENPCSDVLDFLGFPWILSSESNLFNGLRGQNRQKKFHALLVAFKAVGDGTLQWRHADGQDLPWGELSLDSNFPQQIALRALLHPSQHKSNSPLRRISPNALPAQGH